MYILYTLYILRTVKTSDHLRVRTNRKSEHECCRCSQIPDRKRERERERERKESTVRCQVEGAGVAADAASAESNLRFMKAAVSRVRPTPAAAATTG